MADVTPYYGRLRAKCYAVGLGKEELKALGVPDRAHLLACFQAMEDYMVANFGTIKANGDTALGATTTTEGFKKMFAAYCSLRTEGIL